MNIQSRSRRSKLPAKNSRSQRRKSPAKNSRSSRRKSPAKNSRSSRRKSPVKKHKSSRRKSPVKKSKSSRRKSPVKKHKSPRRKSPVKKSKSSRRKSPVKKSLNDKIMLKGGAISEEIVDLFDSLKKEDKNYVIKELLEYPDESQSEKESSLQGLLDYANDQRKKESSLEELLDYAKEERDEESDLEKFVYFLNFVNDNDREDNIKELLKHAKKETKSLNTHAAEFVPSAPIPSAPAPIPLAPAPIPSSSAPIPKKPVGLNVFNEKFYRHWDDDNLETHCSSVYDRSPKRWGHVTLVKRGEGKWVKATKDSKTFNKWNNPKTEQKFHYGLEDKHQVYPDFFRNKTRPPDGMTLMDNGKISGFPQLAPFDVPSLMKHEYIDCIANDKYGTNWGLVPSAASTSGSTSGSTAASTSAPTSAPTDASTSAPTAASTSKSKKRKKTKYYKP